MRYAFFPAALRRRGVTIIEVLFAMGIILAGLVGVAALLPVAGRDATNAVQLDVANRLARSTASSLKSRGVGSLSNLIYFNDNRQLPDDTPDVARKVRHPDAPATGSGNEASYWGLSTEPPKTQAEAAGWRSVQRYIFPTYVNRDPRSFSGIYVPPPGNPPAPAGNSTVWWCAGLDAPGFGFFDWGNYATSYPRGPGVSYSDPDSEYRSGHMASFCIDSKFLSEVTNGATPTGFDQDGEQRSAYQATRFPYYSEWYQPLSAPNAAVGGGYASGFPHPRMWRAGFGNVGPTAGAFLPAQVAAALSSEDFALSMHTQDDSSKPVQQILQHDGANAAKRQSEQRFSWIATLVPVDERSDRYELTVVVIDRRVIESLNAAPAMNDADTNPLSERVFWAADPISFGSTTMMTLYGSQSVSDRVVAGEWLMLSNQPYEEYTTSVFRPSHNTPAVHQWVRIASVGETERGPFSDTHPPLAAQSLADCWRRDVIVDASVPTPTVFLSGAPTAKDRLAERWHATVVDGAVAVSKSQLFVDINQ